MNFIFIEVGMFDSRKRMTNISRSYSGKKEERKATMVSKLEYVGEHSMMVFSKEQTEHSGHRNVEFFKNLFLFTILLSFYNFIKNIYFILKDFDIFY